MATISSPGLASGLDVKGIVSQLVALERAPLQALQSNAASIKSKLSVFGSIKSAVAGLGEAAKKLSDPAMWDGIKASTSNAAGVTVSASSSATPGRMSLQVTSLATAQSAVSGVLNTASGLGAGVLTFTSASGQQTSITVGEDADSPAQIAAQINADRSLGVSATVLSDASGSRLLFSSRETGAANTFTVSVTGGNSDGLQRLAFSGAPTSPMTQVQPGANARFTINGVALESASNTVRETVPGLTFGLLQAGATADISVSTDTDGARRAIQSFVDAYNSVNSIITSTTSFNEESKVGGTLQGDSTARGIQTALQGMLRSVTPGGEFVRLSDIGITFQRGGGLQVDASKLDSAMSGKLGEIKKLFADDRGTPMEDGFGLKVSRFATGLSEGLISSRQASLQSSVARNEREQTRVADRVARQEARLLAQYNALDARVGSLNGLAAFVSQQVTLWNNGSNR